MKIAWLFVALLISPMVAAQTQNDLLTQARTIANADYYAECPTIQQVVASADARLQVPQDAQALQQLKDLVDLVAAHKQLWSRFHSLEQGPALRATGLELEALVSRVSAWNENITTLGVPEHEALLKLGGDDLLTAINTEAASHQSPAIPAATRLAYVDVRLAVLNAQGRIPGALQGIRDDLAAKHEAQVAQAADWVERASQQLANPAPGILTLLGSYPETVAIRSHLASAIKVLQENGDLENAADAQRALEDFQDRADLERQHLALALTAVMTTILIVGIVFARRTITWHQEQGEASIGDLIGGTQ